MFKINFKDRIFESDGSVKTTRIQIQEDMTVITKVVSGDVVGQSDELLIKMVLEQFYQDTFPNRAENERFEEFNNKLALVDKKLKEMDEMKKELEITQGSLMDLISQISGQISLTGVNQDENISETQITDKGGDNNDGNVIRD